VSRSRFLVIAFSIALLTSQLGCGSHKSTTTEPEALYQENCARCHARAGEPGGPTMGGSLGPNLSHIATEAETMKPGMDARAYISESIHDPQAFIVPGYPPVMPSFRGTLTEDEINQVIAFLLTKQ